MLVEKDPSTCIFNIDEAVCVFLKRLYIECKIGILRMESHTCGVMKPGSKQDMLTVNCMAYLPDLKDFLLKKTLQHVYYAI